MTGENRKPIRFWRPCQLPSLALSRHLERPLFGSLHTGQAQTAQPILIRTELRARCASSEGERRPRGYRQAPPAHAQISGPNFSVSIIVRQRGGSGRRSFGAGDPAPVLKGLFASTCEHRLQGMKHRQRARRLSDRKSQPDILAHDRLQVVEILPPAGP